MNNLSQRDPKWSLKQLGTSSLTIGNYGCYITSLAMLAYTTPDIVNDIMVKGKGFSDGCMVISAKASELLGLKYNGKLNAAENPWPTKVCIAEVDFVPKTSKNDQHFVVWLGYDVNGDWQIKDPWTGKNEGLSKYKNKVVSFRMFEEKSQEVEPLNADLKTLLTKNEHEIRLLQKDAINRLYEETKAYEGGAVPESHDLSKVLYIVKELQQIDKQFDELRVKIVSIINS